MEHILEQVRMFADNAHGSQMRKYTPERYIVHPVRVMETCKQYQSNLPMLAAALLHDVLEDTQVKRDELLYFLKNTMSHDDALQTLLLVEELTDVYVKADYPNWNRKERKLKELERIKLTSPDAQTIKYADILDNSKEIIANDPGFAVRFLKECLAVLKNADKGNKELYKKVLDAVRDELNKIRK